MEGQKNTLLLTANTVNARKQAWLNTLPANLSNLFFFPTASEGLERVIAYKLDLSDSVLVTELQNTVNSIADGTTLDISIEMGAHAEKFAPIFALNLSIPIDATQTEEVSLYIELLKVPENEIMTTSASNAISYAKSEGDNYTEVTKSIAELFSQKWQQLADLEIGNAFSGFTYGKVPLSQATPTEQMEKMRRVKSYQFSQDDTTVILEYILSQLENSEYPDVKILLGAGLIVQLDHPFNFRPIIFTGPSNPANNQEVGTYFERAKPCPPFCKD